MNDGEVEQAFAQELGRIIRARRQKKQLSQCFVAERMGVHRNTINRWENGEQTMDIWHFLRLADVLEITHIALLPRPTYTWGKLYADVKAEEYGKRPVQRERDPVLTADEERVLRRGNGA